VRKVFVLLLISAACFHAALWSQETHKKLAIYSVEDGLSQSSVSSLMQDVYGYIWISTGNGLNCFDGKSFTNYFPPLNPKNSFNVNHIRKVVGDEIGNLWVGSDEGLYYFNRITKKMEDPFPEINILKKGFCYPLFIIGDTLHSLISDSSLMSINIHDHKYKQTNLGAYFFWIFLLDDNSGEVAGVSTNQTIWFFNSETDKLNIREFRFSKQVINQLSSIKHYKDDKYFVLLRDELLLFNKTTGELGSQINTGIPHEAGKNNFKSITTLKSGDIWIGTNSDKIFILNSSIKYKYDVAKITRPSKENSDLMNFATIFEDEEGNIWVGSDGYGLGLFKTGNSEFGLVNLDSPTIGKLSSDFIWSFYEDDENNLWIGTSSDGINKWNRNTNTIESFLLSEKKTFPSANDVYCICQAPNERFLIGTSCGIWLFDKKSHQSYPVSNVFNESHIRRSNIIIPVSKDRYLAQIQNQCYYFQDNGTRNWHVDTLPLADSASINITYQSKSGEFFAFSSKGIYNISKPEISYKPFIYLSGQMTLKVNSIVELTDGLMCSATDKGLAIMDFNSHIYKIYNTTEGLANHYLYGILADSKENLWISSNRGLSCYYPATAKFENYGMKDGLQSYEYNSGATYKNKNGEMFFGGISGFNYFHPDSLYASESCPAIIISGLKVNDVTYLADSSIMSKQVLNLGFGQNTITFELTAIEFTNPDFITYSCFLEGYDQDWVQLGPSAFIRYSQLPPGSYRFRVKAANRQGNWSKTPAQIFLVIERPFWMKTWFYVLIAVLAIGFITIIVNYFSTVRIRNKLAILERQREISLIHSRISADLHDDIGTGLSKLAMLSDTLVMKANGNTEISRRLKKLSANARQLIDQLRVIVWTLNPQYDHLDSLVSYIHQQAGDYLDNSPLKASFTIPETIPSLTVTPEFKRNIHCTLMEVLHNAVKHSGSLEIFIKMEFTDNWLSITIRDNGKGFDPEKIAGFGNGLHFIRKRMEDIGGSADIRTTEGSGTTIILNAKA
jgi:ligand-binding sensor domain-containing protein/signal transduction histidine kinase